MTAPTPLRLRMSRLRGSNLHALSHAANGLPVRVVTRATPFGNPFRHVRDMGAIAEVSAEGAEVVAAHRRWLCEDPAGRAIAERARAELAGHNLACFCRLCPRHAGGLPVHEACRQCDPCHAETLLLVAGGATWDSERGVWLTGRSPPAVGDGALPGPA